ncbi:MAG: O-methyltransferase [Candidatus Aenigmarchaeota archaeon]|nr:O-methyltransferase [Candidatus Aenigmarchaeota archaeon]
MGIEEVMREIEAESSKGGKFLPIVGSVKGNFLYMLAKVSQAKNVLDLGTLTGYSALLLSKCVGKDGRIVTVENDKTLFEEALKNFKKAKVKNIRPRFGDAKEILRQMKDRKFDFIFLDIWKEDYVKVLDDCVKLLKVNGLLVADNALWDEEPLKEWRKSIFNHKQVVSFLVPLGDGMSVSMRIK